MKAARLVWFALGCLAGLTLTSCASDPSEGWAMGGGYRNDVRSVAVPVWDNQTFYPGLEAQLTEAIIKEIQRSTPWVVVSGGASTTLTGTIVAAELRKLGTDNTTGLVQDMAFDLAVDFEWRSNRTRRPLISRSDFRAQGGFIPTRGLAEPIELGQLGAIEVLARDIVAELRSDW